jgi:antitoxin (DNA-binding transcriptional repressor) of toxin-antitoxin stability system
MNTSGPTRVNVREFRANLSRYLKQAEAGAAIAILSHDKIVAELRPPAPPAQFPCTFGALKDKITLTPGWDDPDEELIDIMINGPIFPDDAA